MKMIKNLIYRKDLKSLRYLKIAQWIFNLLNYRRLSYLKPLYKNAGLKRSVLLPLQFEDVKHLASTPLWLDKNDSQLALKNHPTFLRLKPEHQIEILKWSELGYVHLTNFFDTGKITRIAEITEDLWNSNKGAWRKGDRRVLSAFENKEIHDLLHQPDLIELLNMLMGQEVSLLNSINFLRGDEQPIHSDSFYMATHPQGRMLGTWTSLEDIHRDAAPLCYIPGSHRLPYITNRDLNNIGDFWSIGKNGNEDYIIKISELIEEKQLIPKFHLPKKGDLFIWHANLLHGGSKKNNPDLTRKSLVGHYTATNVICYHENSQRPALRYTL